MGQCSVRSKRRGNGRKHETVDKAAGGMGQVMRIACEIHEQARRQKPRISSDRRLQDPE